jgi:hypothetical protein
MLKGKKKAKRVKKPTRAISTPRIRNGDLMHLAFRMFGPSIGVTLRPELRAKVQSLNRESPELMSTNKRLLMRFFLHGRHDNIRFSAKPGAQGFLVKEGGDGTRPPRAKKMRGIHGMLKKTFYPDFDHSDHRKLAQKAVSKQARKSRIGNGNGNGKGNGNGNKKKNAVRVSQRDKMSGSGCDWAMVDVVAQSKRGVGMELGKQVHKQLEIFARDRAAFSKVVPRPDPLVAEIIRKLVGDWSLVPLWSEYEIWDETLRYATSVDLICFHPKKGRLVFFEVKTGYRDSFSFSTGRKIKGRFGIDSTPLNHAFLQILIPIETMKRHYGIRAIDGYVLHVNEQKGVTVYKVPTNAQLPRDKLYNHVVRANKREEKARVDKRKKATSKRSTTARRTPKKKRKRSGGAKQPDNFLDWCNKQGLTPILLYDTKNSAPKRRRIRGKKTTR